MNVTIHQGAAGFPAIKYSEDKIEESRKAGLTGKDAKVELVAMHNFPLSNATHLPYWAKELIMLDWCKKSQVSVRQLHFSVSCRGGENTEGELKAAAEYLLGKMGYARCPALFYIHRDTKNLHMHVVTTKSDENGHKVSDWHNARYFRECLDRYEGQNIELNANRATNLAFSYHFTESRHFISLLSSMGFRTSRDEDETESKTVCTSKEKQKSNSSNTPDMLFLYRNRKKVGCVSKDKIRKMIEANRLKAMTEAESNRKKELSAIMHDYRKRESKDFYMGRKPITKADLKIDQIVRSVNRIHNEQMAERGIMRNDLHQMSLFQSDMEKEFGLDIIYNFDRTGVPNGFIVLDHQAKRVWRGSELGFKFKEFLRPDEKALRKFITDGRFNEAFTVREKEMDGGFNGAVAMETRVAKGGTVFVFYGLDNIVLLPKDLGREYRQEGIPIRWMNHDEMEDLKERGVKVRIHQSVYDSIPFADPLDADESLHTENTNDESMNYTPSPNEGVGLSKLGITNVVETVGSTIHTASDIVENVMGTTLNVLESTLETPMPTPAVAGGQSKDLESSEAKKRRKRRGF